MASLLTDDFNRANSTTVLGWLVSGGAYTVRLGTWGINGNAAYTSASLANAHVTFPAAANVDIQATFPVLVASAGLIARWVDTSNYWLLGTSGSGWALCRYLAGSITPIVTGPVFADGDVARLITIGKNIYAYINGKLVMYWEDQYYSAATAVAGFRISSSTTFRIDDLSAADAPASAPGAPTTGKVIDLDEMLMLDIDPTPPRDGWLYRGRDTKTADAGKGIAMATIYQEFDSTVQNIIPDLLTKILTSSDWSRVSNASALFTTSGVMAVGATSVPHALGAASAAGIGIGSTIRLGAEGAADAEYRQVTAASATTLTIPATTYTHPSGSNVYLGNTVVKAVTAGGADMICDLSPVNNTAGYYITIGHYQSYASGVIGAAVSRFLHWRLSGGARSDVIHVIVSAGKEHLFVSVEGPRPGETNPVSVSYGSPRTYMFMSSLTPYHSSDTTPVVVSVGVRSPALTPTWSSTATWSQSAATTRTARAG